MLALQKRSDPLETHARIDRLHLKLAHRSVFELLVLHEDNVPDLDEAIAVLFRRPWRPAPDVIAVIKEYLGARSAGSGWAHLPEVVVCRDPDDPVLGQAHFLPDAGGLVIRMVNGDQEALPVYAEVTRQQVPREWNGLVLEVVSKGEVSEHLEERMVASGVANIVEVIVLAAGTDALLGRCGSRVFAGFQSRKQVLELDHARVDEHQCRVIARNKR